MTDEQRARHIVDLLRSVMYSGNEGSNNLFDEILDLANQLNDYDQITAPVDPNANRIIQLASVLRRSYPAIWNTIECLND